jgi:hypothetical protein
MGGPEPTIIRVERAAEIADALDGAAVSRGRPVVVLVGGAGGMDESHQSALDALLREAVLPVVAERGAAIVDGGTDSGVMRALGRAREALGGTFPLVGVAAAGTVVVPGSPPPMADAAELEAHHTHVVLVPGSSWGAESPWLPVVADAVAGAGPSVTLLVNGGEIAYQDVDHSLERERPVVVLAGTGRTADAIAAAGPGSDPRARRIAADALTSVVPIGDPAAVRAAVRRALA